MQTCFGNLILIDFEYVIYTSICLLEPQLNSKKIWHSNCHVQESHLFIIYITITFCIFIFLKVRIKNPQKVGLKKLCMMIKKQDWNPQNESKTEKNVFFTSSDFTQMLVWC